MQNHGGYEEDYANFPPTVDLSEYGDFPQAENYFSLVKESDSAFEALVHYFEKVDEPTLICFFGDHQPSIEQSYYELLYGKKMEELSSEELEKRYQTPFVIWTNYKMESGEIDKISANYLGDLVLLASGRDLEGFEAYTYQLYKKYPVISVNGIYDTEGNYYVSEDQIDDNLLKEYQCMSYYRMKTTYKR